MLFHFQFIPSFVDSPCRTAVLSAARLLGMNELEKELAFDPTPIAFRLAAVATAAFAWALPLRVVSGAVRVVVPCVPSRGGEG
jgi:hypothetical protein